VTAGEQHAEPLVADVGQPLGLGSQRLAAVTRRAGAELLELRLAGPLTAQAVDRTVAGDGEKPGRGGLGSSRLRPALDCRLERVLEGVLGELEVAERVDQRGQDSRPLLAEDLLDDGLAVQGRLRGGG
jgi:hypothetical protein